MPDDVSDVPTKRRRRGASAIVDAHFVTNRYRGYTVPRVDAPIDIVTYGALDPDEFEARYVRARRPCVLESALDASTSDLAGASLWTNAFLRDACARERDVRLEVRDARRGERFGLGKYEKVKSFDAFMDAFERADGGVYLSAGGKEDAFGGPARRLTMNAGGDAARERGKLPLRPMGMPRTLVPADVNLWMGRNSAPTSSGLHHDYHDNLYLLARGEKRFTIFAPADAERMYTTGTIRLVHENGLIVYDEDEDERQQDGDVVLENGETMLERQIREARRSSEARGDDDDDFPDDLDFDGVDDYDELSDSGVEKDEDDVDERATEKDDEGVPSFSRVDYERLERFPLFKDATPMEFTVRQGQALYLPAGWFHDVSSAESGEGHVAFNYWFHPPPLGDPTWKAKRQLWEEHLRLTVLPKFDD